VPLNELLHRGLTRRRVVEQALVGGHRVTGIRDSLSGPLYKNFAGRIPSVLVLRQGAKEFEPTFGIDCRPESFSERGDQRPTFLDQRPEHAHRREDSLCAVGVADVGEASAPAIGVWQQLEERWLVRDERSYELGVAGDELETDRAAATVPIHGRGLLTDGREDRGGILCVERHRDVRRIPRRT
jgi:hypothetical protein